MNKFYEFKQNNSGGKFIVDEKVTNRVIIEAYNPDDANDIAESLGIYFDGDNDCPCCGNRWYPATEFNEIKFPYKYDDCNTFNTIEEYAHFMSVKWRWIKDVDVRIFFKNGTITEY